jgi:Zn-dependent M28 family amino/carboxypeptidase
MRANIAILAVLALFALPPEGGSHKGLPAYVWLPALAGSCAAQSPSQFDSNRAWEHLRKQVAFGPRSAGSAAIAETRRYILGQLKAAGISAREQAFQASTPIGPISMVNVVATIPGAKPDRIAIASHFDTKLFREFRFVGANDGGSSTAVLLELGRVLAARKNPLSYELLFFDGEEATRPQWEGDDNTYGSRYYVDAAKKDGSLKGLRALILLDMVGARNLRIPKESGSTRWLTDAVWAAAAKLGHTKQFVNDHVAVGGDDHYPFLAAGIPAIDIIHDLGDYREWHQPGDDLSAVSARSLQIVGDVVLEALPAIEKRLLDRKR